MATELHVRIRPNPYQGNEAVFWWNGMLNRYSFELRTELAIKLVDDCIPQHVIDSVMDSLDVFEWDQPEYPLGVVYVGEAVCDVPVDDPVYGNFYTAKFAEATRRIERSQRRSYCLVGALLAVLAVAVFVGK